MGYLKDHGGSNCQFINYLIQEKAKLPGHTILLVDEVQAFTGYDNSSKKLICDWSSLQLEDTVDVLLAISPSPRYYGGSGQFQIIEPASEQIFCQHLTQKHRNSPAIDRILSFCKSHDIYPEYSSE